MALYETYIRYVSENEKELHLSANIHNLYGFINKPHIINQNYLRSSRKASNVVRPSILTDKKYVPSRIVVH